MKNFLSKFRFFILIGMLSFLAACTKVPAGNVGVKFDLYGGDKGVTGEVVGPGKYWLGWNEELYLFPTFTVNDSYVEKEGNAITFQDRDGTQITADVGISFSIPADKADEVFQKYRKGVDEIVDTVLKNSVRNALNSETGQMEVSEIYGVGKEALMSRTLVRVQKELGPVGVNVENIFWIGAMKLPPQITSAINAKIEATQKAQQRENELQTAKAQAEIEREKARGEADALIIAANGQAQANQKIASSLTSQLVQYEQIKKWDGKLPQVTGENVPMLQLK